MLMDEHTDEGTGEYQQQNQKDSQRSGQDEQVPRMDRSQSEEIQNIIGEDLRITMKERRTYIDELKLQTQQSVDSALVESQGNDESMSSVSLTYNATKGRPNNIFGKKRSNSENRNSVGSDGNKEEDRFSKQKQEKLDKEFEKQAMDYVKKQKWEELDQLSSQHLENTKGNSFKGFFYLGVSLYKMGEFDNSIRSFQKAEQINTDDSQLHYNLGLANFKIEQYNQAVDHFKKCTKLDPEHPYAYNNLAFLYNMHQLYAETISTCGAAKFNNPKNHNCHRHWAFALFKKGEMAKAIKKIKKAIQLSKRDSDNWVVWGLIMRTVGNYQSAKHKFQKAIKYDPHNETAIFELEIVNKIIELDSQIPIDAVPSIKPQSAKPGQNGSKAGADNGQILIGQGCARACNNNNCIIF